MNKNLFVPLINSSAGNCLTMASIERVGVTSICFKLENLLMRPGIDFCQQISLAQYCGWRQNIVLNAVFSTAEKQGEYSVRSNYDGNICKIDLQALFHLILQLKPQKVLMPKGSLCYHEQYWSKIPSTMALLFAADELGDRQRQETYHQFKTQDSFVQFCKTINEYPPSYIFGDFTYQQLCYLVKNTNCTVETDRPALDALQGIVYCSEKNIEILNSHYTKDYSAVAPECTCIACSKGFTRAYFHHLLQQTPLLCQRFLIEHNMHYCQHHLPEPEFTI